MRVILSGGLGNQLFKFMAAQAYLDDLSVDSLVMDISWYSDQNRALRPKHIFFQLQKLVDNKIYFTHTSKFPKVHQFILREVIALNDNMLQNMKILKDSSPIRSTIRKPRLAIGNFEAIEFLPKFSSADLILQKLDSNSSWKRSMTLEIVDKNPIIMHVRLGDYLKYPEIYGFVNEKYYVSAIKLMRSLGQNGPVWLSSDSPEYAMKMLLNKIKVDKVLRTPPELEPMQLLLTLAESKNIIISHSTFSWWSAWISSHRNRETNIVMPNRFLAHESEAHRLQVTGWHIVKV